MVCQSCADVSISQQLLELMNRVKYAIYIDGLTQFHDVDTTLSGGCPR